MKKLLTMLLAALLTLSLGVVALAADEADEAVVNVAKIGDIEYGTLEEAIEAAADGSEIELIADIETNNPNKKRNNDGVFAIGKNITINGNSHTVKAVVSEDAAGDTTVDWPQQDDKAWNVASMFNVVNGATVTFKDLTIDSNSLAKHGINIYGATVAVSDVTINNGKGYAIVCNSSTLTVDGLETSGNGWGGINGDARIDNTTYSITINNTTIEEENSVCLENQKSVENNALTINEGSFVNVGEHPEDYPENAPKPIVSIVTGIFGNNVLDLGYVSKDSNVIKVELGDTDLVDFIVGSSSDYRINLGDNGGTLTVLQASKDIALEANEGVTVKNETDQTVTVNGDKTVAKDESYIVTAPVEPDPEPAPNPDPVPTPDPKPAYRDTRTIVIGGSDDKDEQKKEEINPPTGAPVFVAVTIGALAAAK